MLIAQLVEFLLDFLFYFTLVYPIGAVRRGIQWVLRPVRAVDLPSEQPGYHTDTRDRGRVPYVIHQHTEENANRTMQVIDRWTPIALPDRPEPYEERALACANRNISNRAENDDTSVYIALAHEMVDQSEDDDEIE